MKTKCIVLSAISLFVFAGCSTTDDTAYGSVHEGMSRNVLRANCGEPLRIEPGTYGGEDWYYHFSSWETQPTGSSGTSDDFGQQTTYVSASLSFSKEVVELPVHVSPDGFVVPPLPKGKVVKN
jgi:outer membrane protein assembly factor BamE (lipoprotein component of BamABCDE complex)